MKNRYRETVREQGREKRAIREKMELEKEVEVRGGAKCHGFRFDPGTL